ncbi:MAG: FHA domain-containing protein [Chloroflexota bacterium]
MSFENSPPHHSSGRRTASLIVKQGPQIGIQFPLPRENVIVGREETCDIIIQDAEASRRHTQIRWEGENYVLHDLGSTNGTFLNGIQLAEPTILNAGDTIGLGQTTLIFDDESSRRPQVDYAAPNEDAYVIPPDLAPTSYFNRETLQKFVLGGCGCSILLFICAIVIPGTMHLAGIIDLTDILNLLGI